MAELWGVFCEKLQEAGYALTDLEYCDDDVFLTLAEELGVFSPLQVSSLLNHWHRQQQPQSRKHPVTAGAAPAVPVNGNTNRIISNVRPAPPYPAASVRQVAQRLLQRVCRAAAAGQQQQNRDADSTLAPVTQDVIGVEAPLSAWHAFQTYLARQQKRREVSSSSAVAADARQDPVALLWKLCSPETLAKIERACATSTALTLGCEDDADRLCESGIVLYDGELATTLGTGGGGRHQALDDLAARVNEGGWALVAFDAVVGRTRLVTVEEVGNLRHFSMGQCREMLAEAGYDSLSIASVGAVVLCDATQFVPRNVVYVQVPTTTAAAAGPPPVSVITNTNNNGAHTRTRSVPALAVAAAAAPTTTTTVPQSNHTHMDSRRLEYSALPSDGNSHIHTYTRPAPQPPSSSTSLVAPQQQQQQQQPGALAVSSTGGGQQPQEVTTADALITRCDVHPQKEVEFWCATEKRLLCSHCLYYDGYSRENCLPMEVAARQEVPRLERWIGNATVFSKEVQAVVQLFTDAKADIARQEEKVSKDIGQQFAHLREKLNALEADLQHEVREQSRGQRQEVESAAANVQDTVGEVSRLLREVDAPLKRYRAGGSATGLATCVQLLRGVQRAFSDWPAVDIAAYSTVRPIDACLASAEAALAAVPRVALGAGKVEVPLAIDVNYLHADCE